MAKTRSILRIELDLYCFRGAIAALYFMVRINYTRTTEHRMDSSVTPERVALPATSCNGVCCVLCIALLA